MYFRPFTFTRIDLYVISVIFRPMRNIFLFVLIILECVRFRLGLNLAMHQENFFALVFTYMSQWLALYAGLAMQMALAVGVMLGFARLAQNRELDALHALGFSLHRLLFPAGVMALAIAIADFCVLGWLQPISLYNSASLVHQVQRVASLLPEGGDFFISAGDKTVLIDGIAPKSNSFKKIFVYQTYPDGKGTATGGTSGHLTIVDDDPNQYYDVADVRMIQVVAKPGPDGPILPQAYNASSSSELKGPVQAIDTSNFRKRGESEWEMTFWELATGTPPQGFKVKPSAIGAELNYRIVQLLFILLLPALAILFVVEPRRNPGPFRFLAGLLTILGFHQFLGMAVSFSRGGAFPVWLTLWLPLAVLACVVLLRFRWLSLKPGFSSAR
ncbi:MAG: LptF/LptG family permease [Alphaproteobacteria bacterium]|nr:LptF/LptG family permease [Alphaproteobacteria bacterium]